MSKVHEHLGKANPVKGLFGIEVEVEGQDLPYNAHGNWKVDGNEGSLRDGGLEYIFKRPLSYAGSIKQLHLLKKYFKDNRSKPVFSQRTSVHVHVNVSDLYFNHMCNFIFLALLFEGNLSHFCGESRKGNPFCITGKFAEGVYEGVSKIFESKKLLQRGDEQIYRYGFINLASITKYGSVEFRGMYGTLDIPVLDEWISMLKKLRELATTFATPLDIISAIKKNGGVLSFARKVLTPSFRYNMERVDLHNSYDMARLTALTVEDWDEPVKDKIPKMTKGNPFINALHGEEVFQVEPVRFDNNWVAVDGADVDGAPEVFIRE